MKILALIPARAGSKGIAHKNIANVAGKPLIAWTILAAKAARGLDRVVVSTDSPGIADVGRAYGAEVPFVRPVEFAHDQTPGESPAIHALEWLNQHEHYRPDAFMLLQPTSPLRTPADIEAAISLLKQYDADSVISVTASSQTPYWMKTITPQGRLTDFLPGNRSATRRQDLPSIYAPNGAIYLIRCDTFREIHGWYTANSYAYVMPDERSIDIDTQWHLHLADLVLRNHGQH